VSDEPATITPYRDGPYIVRGNFTVTDQDGNVIANERKTIALCRCGRSQTRPFCDGTHKLIDFRAAGGDERQTAAASGARSDDSPAVNAS
jgi:CDGSH-type Zn-finger protein